MKTAFWLHSGLLPESGEIFIFVYSIVYLCAPPWGLCSRSIRIEGREFISFAGVSSGSRDWCLPADGGALVTGGDWPAGGRCCWSRSCLLIPVQVSHTAERIRALKPPPRIHGILFKKCVFLNNVMELMGLSPDVMSQRELIPPQELP